MLALIGFISRHVLLARFRDHETVVTGLARMAHETIMNLSNGRLIFARYRSYSMACVGVMNTAPKNKSILG
jgi:hypothetical protein